MILSRTVFLLLLITCAVLRTNADDDDSTEIGADTKITSETTNATSSTSKGTNTGLGTIFSELFPDKPKSNTTVQNVASTNINNKESEDKPITGVAVLSIMIASVAASGLLAYAMRCRERPYTPVKKNNIDIELDDIIDALKE